MGCQHLEEVYELWWLNALAEQSSCELQEHLARGCPHCLERLREAAETVYVLGLSSKPVRPHPRVKAELIRKITPQVSPER